MQCVFKIIHADQLDTGPTVHLVALGQMSRDSFCSSAATLVVCTLSWNTRRRLMYQNVFFLIGIIFAHAHVYSYTFFRFPVWNEQESRGKNIITTKQLMEWISNSLTEEQRTFLGKFSREWKTINTASTVPTPFACAVHDNSRYLLHVVRWWLFLFSWICTMIITM